MWNRRYLALDSKSLRYYASRRALLEGAPYLGCASCLHVRVQESAANGDGFFFTVIDSDGHRLEFCVSCEEERREWCERIRERASWVEASLDFPEDPCKYSCALGRDYELDGDYDIMDPLDDKKHVVGHTKQNSQVSLRFKYVPCKVLMNEYETETEEKDDDKSEDDDEERGVI